MKFSKKIVLFDIDSTLFDAKKFREKILSNTIRAIGYKASKSIEKKLLDLYIASRRLNGFFNQKLFIKDVISKFNINSTSTALAKAIFNDSVFSGNLYIETKQVLESLSKDKLLSLGIFSRGYPNFQIKKIKEVRYFLQKEHVHIFLFKDRELPKVVKKYKECKLYIIDDSLNTLYKAKSLNKNIFAIWIKRGDRALKQKPILGFAPDVTIINLRDVAKLVSDRSKF